jgi:vancomycin permeability regulator SanA
MNRLFRNTLIIMTAIGILTAIMILAVDYYVSKTGQKYLYEYEEVPEADAIIVLGAYVFPDGRVSDMLADRLNYGYKLFDNNKSNRIIVSGDNGQVGYDEVNGMRQFLQSKGVPRENIFMDHAGFSTYDTLYRARDVFHVKKAIIVSQEYHLRRALYIAKKLGIEAYGVSSDTYIYPGMKYYRLMEVGARFKAFLQTEILKSKPKYLGDAIPIWKNGELTDDGKS